MSFHYAITESQYTSFFLYANNFVVAWGRVALDGHPWVLNVIILIASVWDDAVMVECSQRAVVD